MILRPTLLKMPRGPHMARKKEYFVCIRATDFRLFVHLL